jgi:alpha-L-rhamnosidase
MPKTNLFTFNKIREAVSKTAASRNSRPWRMFFPAVLGLLLGVGASPVFAGGPPTPSAPANLRVDDVSAPVGTEAVPYFGWLDNDSNANEIQTGYEILVATSAVNLDANNGDVWDSGQVAGSSENHVVYAGAPLTSDTQYYWKVRTWNREGNAGPYSTNSNFTVGLLSNSDWSAASWIWRSSSASDDYTYYRKSASLPAGTITRATVYVSSVQKYALYVNGTLVGKGPIYAFPQYQFYNAYDITSLIAPGVSNVFAVFNHWFGGGSGRVAAQRGILMEAIIHYADGSSVVVGTDGTWLQSQATSWVAGEPSRGGSGTGYIEDIDARNLTPTWFQPGFDDSAWANAAVFGPQPNSTFSGVPLPDLTRIVETVITPVSVTSLGNNSYMVDLGKLYSGVPSIQFSGGTSGTTVGMFGGFALNSGGTIDPNQNQTVNMSYFTVLNGSSFTYQAAEYETMRYFEITNSPMPVTTANFSFIERNSRMDDASSSFTSPNTTLNAVWGLMKQTLPIDAQEEFIDSMRQKGGFLGDGYQESLAAMEVENERVLTRSRLNEFIESMVEFWSNGADIGRVNACYPDDNNARDIPDYTQMYMDWVWEYYLQTGDIAFLNTNYTQLTNIAQYVNRDLNPANGLITRLYGGTSSSYTNGIIDWPPDMQFNYDLNTVRSPGNTATVIDGWAWEDYDIMSRIASEVGNTADSATYRAMANALQAAINTNLINAAGVYIDGLEPNGSQSAHASQHANAFPLSLNIVPAAQVPAVTSLVVSSNMSVSMLGIIQVVRALGEANQGPALLNLYTNANQYGWAQILSFNGTATWESWTANTDGNSESHGWGAVGLDGYVRYILGIKPLTAQFDQVQIMPLDFGNNLSTASGTVTTDRGAISVEWDRSATLYHLAVTIPDNVTATIYVPQTELTDTTVTVDGVNVTGTLTNLDGTPNGYLGVSGIGSGTHNIQRVIQTLPVAAFSGTPTNGAAPLTVTFANLSINATNFVWNFGDGSTLNTTSNTNVTDTYTGAGSYTVILTATGLGVTNSLTNTAYIVVTNPPPVHSIANADNGGNLTAGASWVGGVAPGSGDVAVFDSTITSANPAYATNVLGADTAWGEIQILNPAVPIQISAGNTLTLNGVNSSGIDMSQAANALTLNCPVALGANQTWLVANGQTLNVNGVVSGSSMLTINDGSAANGGSVIFGTQANTYTGGTVINGGIVQLGNSASLGTGAITDNGGTMSVPAGTTINNSLFFTGTSVINLNGGGGGNNSWPGSWSGNGTIIISNMDVVGTTLTMGGADSNSTMNNFTGKIIVASMNSGGLASQGTLRFNSGTSTYNAGNASASFNLGTNVNDAVFLTSRAGGTINLGELIGGPSTVLLGSRTTAGTTIWSVGGLNTSTTFAGSISNYSTTEIAALTKVGTGTLTLTCANTYSGGTTVNGGTLLVNNTTGSGTGSGSVTVNSGAALGGTGTISGNVNWESGSAALFTAGSPLTVGGVALDNNTVTVNVPGVTPLGVGSYTLMNYTLAGSTGSFATGTPSFTGAGFANGTTQSISTSGGSVILTVNPGPASKLVFTTQPGTTMAGSSISPAVVVTVEDTYGNTVTSFNGVVTIGSGTTSFTGGTLSVNAVAGVATFSAINPTTAGSANTLYANGDSLPQATSGTFTVNSTTASKLVFTTQPGTTVAGSSISPAVVVTVEDTYGNTVTSFNGVVTIGSGTTSFTGGTLSVNAVAGVATFSAINPTTAGSANTLYANGDSLPQVTSSPFTVLSVGQAQNIYKAATATMSASTDWTTTPGGSTGIAPSASYVGEFGGTPTQANLSGMALGGAVSLAGLQLDNNMAGPLTITADGNTLTLGANGINLSAANQSATVGNLLALGANQTWLVANGQTLNVNGVVSGSSMLTINDGSAANGGSVIFGTQANTYTGGTVINGGNVTFGTNASAGTGTITLVGGTLTMGAFTFANAVNVTGTATITNNSGGSLMVSGNFAGAGTLNLMEGTGGTITWSAITGLSAFTGTIKVSDSDPYSFIRFSGATGSTAATFDLGNGLTVMHNRNGQVVNLGALKGGANSTLEGARTANASSQIAIGFNGVSTTFYGTISNGISIGAPTLVSLAKYGTGTLTLAGPNAYTGPTTNNAGVLNAGIAEGNNAYGNYGPFGSPATVANSFVFGGGTLQYSSLNNYDYSGRFSTAANQPISIDVNGQSVTFATALAGSGGGLTLSNAAPPTGKLTLSATPAYTGATTIDGGTLALTSGPLASGSALTIAAGGAFDVSALSSPYTLGAGLTASGAGTTASTAATIVPASGGIFDLNTQPITLVWGGASSDTDSAHPALTVSQGTLNFNGNTITVVVPGTALSAGVYTLISAAAITGTPASAPSYSYIGGNGVAFGYTGVISVSGSTVILTVTKNATLATWTDGASDQNWFTIGNWNPATVPQNPGDIANLGTSANSAVTLNQNASVAGIEFTNASSYTISGANTLTLDNKGGGAELLVTGGTANTIATPVALNDNSTILVSANDSLNISGVVANAPSVTKTLAVGGGGTAVLGNANTYGPLAGTVGTTLIGGILQVGNNTSLGAGDVSMAGSGTLQSGASGLNLANNITVQPGITVTVDNNGNAFTLGGVVSGAAGNLAATGSGTVLLNGVETYTGGTAINAGTLMIGGSGQLGSGAYAGNIADAGILDYASSAAQTLSGIISGAGGLTVDGAGTLALSGANTFTGNIVVNGGILSDAVAENNHYPALGGLGNPQVARTATINNGAILSLDASGGNEFGSGEVADLLGYVINKGGLLRLTSGNATIGPVTLNGGTMDVLNGANGTTNGLSQWGTYDLTDNITVLGTNSTMQSEIAGLYCLTASNTPAYRTFTVSNGASLNVTAALGDSSGLQGPAGLVLTGPGWMTLSATNTYTGGTIISNGTLLVNGINSNGVVTISGGTLGGSGTFGGAVTCQSGGTLAPGAGVGTAGTVLTINSSLTLAPGSACIMVVSHNGHTNDQIVSSGVSYGGTLTVITNAGDGALVAGDTFQLFNSGTYGGAFSATNLPALSPGLVWGNSLAINGSIEVVAVVPLAASQLVVTTQPSASTVAGVAFAQQPVVTIEDQFGNTVTSGADSTVSVGLALTTGTGALGGTISMNAVNGVADFTGKGLSINYVGTDKVLTATATVAAGTRTTTTGPAFAITLPPISILRGPGAGVKIHVSNLLTSDATWDGYGSQAYASSDSTTANSVSLAISGSGNSTLIVYPGSAANTADSFNYTITDSNGTRTGTVNIVINTSLTGQAGSISVNGSGATMTFYGVPGDHYTVQRAGAVNGPWTDITVTSGNASVDNSLDYSVITAPSGGAFTVTDAPPPVGSAYYQLRVVP